MLWRNELGRVFSTDPGVIALVAKLVPICALFQIVDGFQGVYGGVLRGLGRQGTIAVINVFALWVVGVPVGYTLCFDAQLSVKMLFVCKMISKPLILHDE
jgi:MATE family multidrug resistance protein